MKTFRKTAVWFTALSLIFALCACGGKKEEPPKEEPAAAEASQETTEEKEEATEAAEEEAEAAEETAEEETAEEETAEEAPEEEPEETDPLKKYAGTYTFLCGYFSAEYMDREIFDHYAEPQDIDDQYIEFPSMEGEYVQLDPDGKGYLFWGENNQGPIDDWAVEGEDLTFHAGVAEITGTIIDGLMTIEIDKGCTFLFTAPDADTSGIEPMSSKDYFKLLYGTGTGSAGGESDVAADGKVYTMFALQNEGYLVESKEADMESILTLKEDGTGSMTMDEDAADIASWTVDGDSILITMDDGSFAKGKYLGDIIELDILGGGSMIIYYATEDADISGYDLMTIEELREAYNKGN